MKTLKRKEIISTFRLSYPVIIGQLGLMMMGVEDSMMVGRLGATPLAAAALANSVVIIILIIGIGIAYTVTPIVAISVGAGKSEEYGTIFRQSQIVAIISGIVLMAATFITADMYVYFNQPHDVALLAASYTSILAISIIPSLIFQTVKQYVEGFSIMKPAMITAILANVINITSNWVLIYGNLGFPQLGLDGAGYATSFSRLFMASAMLFYVLRSDKFKPYKLDLNLRKIDMPLIRKILRLGIPSGVQYFFEVGAFSFAVIMVGWLGTKQQAAHQIAINLASISFMCALGISNAGSIRVGNAVGRRSVEEVRKAGFTAIVLSGSMMAMFGLLFIIFKDFFPSLYINDAEVISITSMLLIITAIFQVFDGVQAVGIGILRGLTDTKVPTLITFVAYWIIALPVGYLFGFIFKLDVVGVWIGLALGLAASATMLTLRFNIKSRHLVDF